MRHPKRPVRLELVLQRLVMDHGQVGERLFPACTRLQTPHDLDPVIVALIEPRLVLVERRLHHQRNVNIGRVALPEAGKVSRRHAQNREACFVQRDAFAHCRGVKRKSTLPIAIADHCHGIASRDRVLVRSESATHESVNAEQRKEVSGNKLTVQRLRPFVHFGIQLMQPENREHTGENLVLITKPLEGGVGET